MSSKKDTRTVTDWTVDMHDGRNLTITATQFTRDKQGGYQFLTAGGVTADFPPGTVRFVQRDERTEPGEPEPADGDHGPMEIRPGAVQRASRAAAQGTG